MRRTSVIGTACAIVALTAAGTGISVANSDDGNVSGAQASQATTAARDATGGGRVNSVERDSEDGATWEVEITKPDGNTVDVRLDQDFQVVVVEGDGDAGG